MIYHSFLNFACIQTRYIFNCRFLFSNSRLSTRNCSVEKSGCWGCSWPFGAEVDDGDGKANDGDPGGDVDGAETGLAIREKGDEVAVFDTGVGVLLPSPSLSSSASALSVMVISPAGADDPVNSLTNSSISKKYTLVPSPRM